MFLKRIDMQGFKSFADKVNITFESSVTGIVGPNGCGKSNITDAVRWVLGEQSVRNMRGSTMTDVIFNGTQNRKKVNLAEVTLVFENDPEVLNSPFKEIEITRRLHRDTHEGEYFINKQPCRLKDVLDLIMDTGLGRDSLSMISQGSISFFAEAKPIERRALFEEAAGVAKYKRRKIESINKLERTQENIERMQDIVDELHRQVVPLKRAANKAKLYTEKKEALKQIEVQVLVHDITDHDQTIKTLDQRRFDLAGELASVMANQNMLDLQITQQRQDVNAMDRSIQSNQEELMSLLHEIQILETRKIEIDEKRKYILEVGNQQQRIAELQALLSDAKQEYEDRLKRQKELKADIDLMNQQAVDINRKHIAAQSEQEALSIRRRPLQSRRDVLKNLIDRPFEAQAGISAILNHKETLSGIHDVVAKLITAHDGYEQAIATSLGGSLTHIVSEDEKSARQAIGFLKRNASGRASFIPLTVVKERDISREAKLICEGSDGYLGLASDFVTCEAIYDSLVYSLLGNVIVCDDLEKANVLAHRLKYGYKIVTLEGDVIHRGGVMSGGKNRESNNLLSARTDLEKIDVQLQTLTQQYDHLDQTLQQLDQSKLSNDQELMAKRISLASIESLVDIKRAKYERLQSEYDQVKPKEALDQASFSDDLVENLNKGYQRRDELNDGLKLARENRIKIFGEVERKEIQLRQLRKQSAAFEGEDRQLEVQLVSLQTERNHDLARLSSEYQYTYEYALQIVGDQPDFDAGVSVSSLRDEIQALGNINMDAPNEYEAVNTRYEFISKQLADLEASRKTILDLIDEMDGVMKVQFKDMFDRINQELDGVFKQLFNGGNATLILEDPDDLLNTGIDIMVQPPGKAVQNIRLFSGGEKSLIAISVLFAILKARHIPLCIFDEVEAALDQGNVERFASYIKNFSAETQFIVVTHRPGTMSKCDVLYGVTMPTQGVSQMLKVRLADAVQLSESEGS